MPKLKLDSTSQFCGKIQQQWTIITDSGRAIDVESELGPHDVKIYACHESLTIAGIIITAEEIIDTAIATGCVTEDGDECDLDASWIEEVQRYGCLDTDHHN